MSYQSWQSGDVRWVDIASPTQDDIDQLTGLFPQFHPLALEDCVSPLERPKLDEFEDHLFLVMQFPVWGDDGRIVRFAEIDLFVGKDFVVTVHDGRLSLLKTMAAKVSEDEAERDALLGPGGSHVAHAIIDQLVDEILPEMTLLDRKVRSFADAIFAPDARRVLREILLVRRDLIGLRRNLRSQIAILTSLEEEDHAFIQRDLDDYFGDIADHMTKSLDLVMENLDFIDSLADTADTIVSQRINDVMRILTVISVIMLPLTLITGFYGMNVPLPFQKAGGSLIGIVVLMFVVTGGMLAFFRHKDWL